MAKFTFLAAYEFDWTVKVLYPVKGGRTERSFVARLRMPDEDELFARRLAPDEGPRSYADQVAEDRAMLEKIVVGWSDIELEGGEPFPFSPENLQTLLRQRPIRLALGKAITEAIIESGERAKN